MVSRSCRTDSSRIPGFGLAILMSRKVGFTEEIRNPNESTSWRKALRSDGDHSRGQQCGKWLINSKYLKPISAIRHTASVSGVSQSQEYVQAPIVMVMVFPFPL